MSEYNYNVLKYDFYKTAIHGLWKCALSDNTISTFILAFCCIDYMGMALHPQKDINDSEDFKEFVRIYLFKINKKYYNQECNLWAARNSLLHVYGESKSQKSINLKFDFDKGFPDKHLQINCDKLYLELPEFISDIIAAVELFFLKKKNNPDLEKWDTKLFKIGGSEEDNRRKKRRDSGKPFLGEITAGDKNHENDFKILDAEPPDKDNNIKKYFLDILNRQLL